MIGQVRFTELYQKQQSVHEFSADSTRSNLSGSDLATQLSSSQSSRRRHTRRDSLYQKQQSVHEFSCVAKSEATQQ